MDSRDEFFQNIRKALGRTPAPQPVAPSDVTALSQDARSVKERAKMVRQYAEANASTLMSQLQDSATQAGWKVQRVSSTEDAAQYIRALARDVEARSILRSTHPVLKQLDIETALSGTGIEVSVMASREGSNEASRDEQRPRLRQQAIDASIGITGVDYAIAETGTCVLLTARGVSRLVSLLPPVHVAVVEPGQVLPSLDELFTLRRADFLNSNLGSYMSLITGPSRSADIEYTLVTGVHGPGEVHMVLVG